MRYFSFFTFLFILKTSSGQNSYSKIFDINGNDAFRNYLHGMVLVDSNIYLNSSIFCFEDSTNLSLQCNALLKIGLNGDLIQTSIIDTFGPGLTNSLSVFGNRLLVSGIGYSPYLGRKTKILVFDKNLSLSSIQNFKGVDGEILKNIGFWSYDSTGYIMGIIDKSSGEGSDETQIYSIDKNYNINWEKFYTNGNFKLECNNIQPTYDGNYAFILWHEGESGAQGGSSGYQILKINHEGDTIKSFNFEDSGKQKHTLLVAKDKNFYFGSNWSPINKLINSTGRINKLNAKMNTIEWSYILPNDPLFDGRIYVIEDFTESKNGDIIACGKVWDNTESEIAGADKNSTYNGFIIKMTPSGEVIWLKVYRNLQTLLDKSIYGKYRHSNLKKIIELPSGLIIAAGELSYSNNQLLSINEAENEVNHLWLLKVNENGCLETEECQEIIRLDAAIIHTQKPIFDIGATWTYEFIKDPLKPNEIIHSFITFEIKDTLTFNGKLAYHIYNNRDLDEEYMYQDDEEIFFWDNTLNDWQLTYDFNSNSGYPIKYIFNGELVETKIKIDTTLTNTFWFGSRGFKNIQNISIEGNSLIGDTLRYKILQNCGNLYGGLRLGLGKEKNDKLSKIGKLRCYKQNNFFHNFGPLFPYIPCDTIFTSIIESNFEILTQNIKIMPNPTRDFLFLSNINNASNYIISDGLGHQCQEGKIIEKIDVSNLTNGLYMITLFKKENILSTLKFVKL